MGIEATGAVIRMASTETDRTIVPALMMLSAFADPEASNCFPRSSNPPPIAAWTVAFGR